MTARSESVLQFSSAAAVSAARISQSNYGQFFVRLRARFLHFRRETRPIVRGRIVFHVAGTRCATRTRTNIRIRRRGQRPDTPAVIQHDRDRADTCSRYPGIDPLDRRGSLDRAPVRRVHTRHTIAPSV